MKKSRISGFVLSCVAGGIMATTSALAAPKDAEEAYFSLYFTNSTRVYYVFSVPLPTNGTVTTVSSAVYTDGTGKIDGVAVLHVLYKTDAGLTEGEADIITDVNGSIVTKGSSVAVAMTLKGSGCAAAGTVMGKSTLNLRFTGTQVGNAVVGSFNGKIVPGVAAINDGKAILLQNSPAQLSVYNERFDIQGKTMRVGKSLIGTGGMCGYYYSYVATGTMDTSKSTVKATLNGVGLGRGTKVSLIGTTQEMPYSLVPQAVAPTAPPTVTVPDDVVVKGKVAGQKVTASGARIYLWD